MPHLYVDLADIKRFFKAWHLEDSLRESCVYNPAEPQYYSSHWTLSSENKSPRLDIDKYNRSRYNDKNRITFEVLSNKRIGKPV